MIRSGGVEVPFQVLERHFARVRAATVKQFIVVEVSVGNLFGCGSAADFVLAARGPRYASMRRFTRNLAFRLSLAVVQPPP